MLKELLYLHANDVANGVVLTLDSEWGSIHDLCVPLIRHPERLLSVRELKPKSKWEQGFKKR